MFKKFLMVSFWGAPTHNLGKVRYKHQYTVKNSIPYKSKILIKDNIAIKSIMNENVKANKLNFRIKIKNKTSFLVLQENIIDKTENLTKENQSYKSIVCLVCKNRMWVSTALLLF